MVLQTVDIAIVISYLLLTLFIGFYFSKKASKNLDAYFLGGKSFPWYILGISNASGMFDISGTMWLIYLLFVYGLKSAWLPWLWPVFNQIFLMVYLSIWLRRSNVLTGAEWLTFRFGKGKGTTLSHISVVIFALVSTIGFIAYAFKGVGKFASILLPWHISPDIYALIIMGITTLYVVKGGMFSVVLTEVLQFAIMTLASIAIGIIALIRVSPEMINRVIPDGWKNILFGWHLDLDWSGVMDSVNDKIARDGYSLFAIFFMMMLFKGILVSMGGPAPNYDMQRILAARSPKEAGLMSGFVNIVLIFPRYLMIAGFTVLALVFLRPELRAMGTNIDFESILPIAIMNFVPIGLLGVLLAGLLSAFMSTFAATVNAAPAYLVNDIYKRYINPNASQKKYVKASYLATLAVAAAGIGFGFVAGSVSKITLWIISALWGGYAAPNILKWYWWRFNGYGLFWGMTFGLITALVVPVLLPDVSALNSFPIILLVSSLASFIGSLLTEPDDDEKLIKFYRTVRPWGFWKPIHAKVLAQNPDFKKNENFRRDALNVIIGMIWQVSLTALPVFIIIKETNAILIGIAILMMTFLILKKNWYDKLEQE